MKRIFPLALFCLFVLSSFSLAAVPADVEKIPSCKYCGMDRGKFAHSRVLIEYDDGSLTGTCSLRCAAVELANNIDKAPVKITVGDYYSKAQIDAEQAFWVLGGSVPGVMTANAKWAFKERAAAEKFMRENGGAPATFDEAMRAAYHDMHSDTKQIRERRKMRRAKLPK